MTGIELKRMRKSLGLSQYAFAAKLGVTQAQVSTYERAGRRKIPARPATIERILAALATHERTAEGRTSTAR